MRQLLVFAAILVLASCQPIMKAIYGIKKPDIENRESITKKALKFGLDTTNIVSVTSKDFPYVLKSTSIPNAAIYDSNGKYIEYRQTDTSCNAGLFDFIPKLNPCALGKYATAIPTTFPFLFIIGPPLFPGLIAASN